MPVARSIAVALFGVALLTACGGGSGSSGPPGSSAVQTRTAAVEGCLRQAGFKPIPQSGTLFGVSGSYSFMNVNLRSPATGDRYTAQVVVFPTPAAARKYRPIITLQTRDDLRNKVVGPIVVDFSEIPDKAYASKIEACAATAG